MSSVSGVSGFNPYAIQQYRQDLFNQTGTGDSGSISSATADPLPVSSCRAVPVSARGYTTVAPPARIDFLRVRILLD